jgi:tetrahydromethanopterin S-methyltransferase subunit A
MMEAANLIPGDFTEGRSDSPVAIAVVGRGVVDVPPELYNILGRYKTENLGIEKMIANVVRRPRIRYLVICGVEEFGHYPGDGLYSLMLNGVDEEDRIKGTRAPIAYLSNVPREAVERFREQLTTIDLVDPKEVDEIVAYDPEYRFSAEKRDELISCLISLNDNDPGPLEKGAMMVESDTLIMDGAHLGRHMNLTADRITSNMLTLPSERLATHMDFVTISNDFRLIVDPQDGQVFEVPSVELATKLRKYLTGGL